ncbi:MAG: hypothetical protein RLZZ196_3128 [Bacteroidota bacterium]|jgi:hypothetical protein
MEERDEKLWKLAKKRANTKTQWSCLFNNCGFFMDYMA